MVRSRLLTITRISLLAVAGMAFATVGCAAHNGTPEHPVKPCCSPTFQIWLHPVDGNSHKGDISITEHTGYLSVDMDGSNSKRSRGSEYEDFRKEILQSSQWSKHSSTPYKSVPFNGPPSDVLVIIHWESGMILQGNEIPAQWKAKIRDLAARH